MRRRSVLAAALALCLGAAGTSRACEIGPSVCALFQNGQAFITWADLATGAAGNNWRYSVYRSTSPITAENYAGATLIASSVLNNSGQLLGGNPNINGGVSYTQAHRQDAAQAMAVLSGLGTPLAPYTGLQVYTATGAGTAYYAVVANSQIGGDNTYIGSTGPIAEAIAAPRPIKYADSLSRGQNYGKITAPAGKPLVFNAHASDAYGGAATYSIWGDYWEWFLTPAEGWQDGRPAVMTVLQDNGGHYPSLNKALEVTHRDTIWNPLGTGGIETFHYGIGITPNPLVGSANRLYLTGANEIQREISWAIDHYGADPNQIHWKGQSMGAWGGANTGMRMSSPRFASVWLSYPVWRLDQRPSASWPGNIWSKAQPFIATVGAPSNTLGTIAANVRLPDGTRWGGAGGYADTPAFIASNPRADLPVAMWTISKDDSYPGAGFSDSLAALKAFQSARRGHAFVWNMGGHEATPVAMKVLDCDVAGANGGVCYGKNLFKLNAPYIAFSNSSIDDQPGTGKRNAFGIYDGDYSGCINCGFKWRIKSDTSNAFDFTVSNSWMGRSPTATPSATLTGTLAATGSGTVTVGDGSAFQALANNNYYFLIGDTEIIKVTSVSGNTITYSSRGQLGTKARSHGAGETIRQFIATPTGPNGGPYTTMTVDMTPRRVQNFLLDDGSTVTCTITPYGELPTIEDFTVADGLWTPTDVKINDSGETSVTCSDGAAIASIPLDNKDETNIVELDQNGGVVPSGTSIGATRGGYDLTTGTSASLVPEPSSMAILTTGIFGAGLMILGVGANRFRRLFFLAKC